MITVMDMQFFVILAAIALGLVGVIRG